ncbi:phytanoyl-CoA dioxygenase family protein [Chloroflexi bacterium TSY]|nr:phytanoyl-CoA dioxygenase family protein [Chloroflexi bacterium TSY]
MYLTASHVNQYHQDGYLLVPELFTQQEVEAMLTAVEEGGRVADSTKDTSDAGGKTARLAIWFELGNDIWTAISTHPRIVNNVRMLMGEEIAFFHGKVMLKEPHSGGAWEWHQDYGYWYNQGYAYPRMMSAFVALDPATRENGCLQVLHSSHLLGRLDHTEVGSQTGAEIERMRRIEEMLERIYCEMSPGSVLFFHCNLLHGSAPNESDQSRRSFIICYNALTNPQFAEKQTSDSQPCPVGPDNSLERFID